MAKVYERQVRYLHGSAELSAVVTDNKLRHWRVVSIVADGHNYVVVFEREGASYGE